MLETLRARGNELFWLLCLNAYYGLEMPRHAHIDIPRSRLRLRQEEL